MREKTIRTMEENYSEMFQGYEVPAPIRRCASLILFRFAVNDICDGMYISNTIAEISGFGDGQGHFMECKRMSEKLAECANEIATQIQYAYCSCIPEESKAELAEIIRNQDLNDTEAVRGIKKQVSDYTEEMSVSKGWRAGHLNSKIKLLEESLAMIQEDMTHIHRAEIIVDAEEAAYIRKILTTEPENESDCFGEDEKMSYTAVFDDGKEIDVQVCGVEFIYDKDESESNTAWAQAVLYNNNGCEITCSDVEDYFFGEWELEHDGETYIVTVSETETKLNAA